MTDPDPYATLGVPRTAGRDEIARAYHRLAKQHHPDAGASPSPHMARINDAWYTLSDPTRRARWDGRHGGAAFEAPHWRPAPAMPDAQASARPMPERSAQPSRLESGRLAAAIVAGVAVLVGGAMIAISIATRPVDDRIELQTAAMSFRHEPDWVRAVGDGDDPPEHRLLAHLATWNVDPENLCTTYGEACGIQAGSIPAGEASILITSHEGGTPPVPDPVTTLPYGLDADAIVGGEPAAFDLTRLEGGLTLAWWQLSPPGFPDRWIEVRALIRGPAAPEYGVLQALETMLGTIEFGD